MHPGLPSFDGGPHFFLDLSPTNRESSHLCRERCFGLPLYNANAREALTERLGLLRLTLRVLTAVNESTAIC